MLEVALAEARVLASDARAPDRARELPTEPCRVEGDAERLTQAFLIVLDNAVKYSDPGRADRPDARRATGAEAEVTLRNVGAGIPPSDLPYVFNRFYRGRAGAERPRPPAAGSGCRSPSGSSTRTAAGSRWRAARSETLVTIHLPLIA